MDYRNHKPMIRPGGAFCVYLALALLVLPLRWVAAVVLAAAVHEGCHYLAVLLCGGRVDEIKIRSGGAVMLARELTPGKELLCVLAGPAGGLMLLLLARWLPRTALCAGMQSVFNLLPVYPLDGGRALRCGAMLWLPERTARRLCGVVERCCLTGIVILGLYGTLILRLGLLPLILAVILLWRAKKNTLQTGASFATI